MTTVLPAKTDLPGTAGLPAAAPGVTTMKAMTAQQREEFERDGYLMVRHALKLADVRGFRLAIDSIYRQRQSLGQLGPDRSLRLRDAADHVCELAELVTHPATFGLVWSTLGWNALVEHSHLDVCPQVIGRRTVHWHSYCDEDNAHPPAGAEGGPTTSVRLAYCLSDVSDIGRGNLVVLPGSHLTGHDDGDAGTRAHVPAGAVYLTARAGDVVFFDSRLWVARSINYSPFVNTAVCIGYTAQP